MTGIGYFLRPGSLWHDTLAASGDAGSRWLTWTLYLIVLSVALPLVIGTLARAFSFRKDDDDAPRKPKEAYAAESKRYRFTLRPDDAAASQNLLELPSPEPAPFTAPE